MIVSRSTFMMVFFLLLAQHQRSGIAHAQQAPAHAPDSKEPVQNPNVPSSSSDKTRNFYQVLEDVLSDFEYDIKNGNVQGLKDMAVRNVATSENIPPSFKTHIELLTTERILKNSKTRVIQCLPCRSKRASLSGDNVVISSAEGNPAELSRIAKMSGIANFMDISFAYQPNGLILSYFITDAEGGQVIWSRSYNSETSRTAAFRRGVDYSQVEVSRGQTEYTPISQYKPTIYYLMEPSSSGYASCIGFGFRAVERYDNRKKEVGFELNYLYDIAVLTGSGAASAAPATYSSIYSGLNLTMLFLHSWNLISDVENFNKARGNIYVAVGGTYATGFLGALLRGGYEWRLGKHWALTSVLGYRPASSAFIGTSAAGPISGVEFGLGVGALF